MKQKPPHGLWLIIITFFVGFFLAAIPMGRFEIARPDWVGMLIIFWVLVLPERFGIFVSFGVGILFDTLAGTTLGLYAFVYSGLAYTVLLLHARLRMYPLGQQAMVVFLILGVTHIVAQWLKVWLMSVVSGELHIWPALTSAVVWPWVYGLLRTLQIKFRVQ
ncbi:rod shape-determining protein MreD [Reinekea blandensis]|uniref:Rod shape-determining protein MreD n=1 Tax=Reinekea blandensis MED297 TaxID=314283 RepID=A4BGL4_9GAMM|nr:rod shape-determining protein MreD [Reinekea blandensis]EAR08662.1 rod shape-determining protein MreD [Reinekea sp. MED297] [Reinekea blandensis MED297]